MIHSSQETPHNASIMGNQVRARVRQFVVMVDFLSSNPIGFSGEPMPVCRPPEADKFDTHRSDIRTIGTSEKLSQTPGNAARRAPAL
jgi:hypothetical protein